ncbi:Homeobox protein homothorax [Aphelenchoides besseyi]|nr:Homeobox protein homothorax [Aphelenchoides besseyi]
MFFVDAILKRSDEKSNAQVPCSSTKLRMRCSDDKFIDDVEDDTVPIQQDQFVDEHTPEANTKSTELIRNHPLYPALKLIAQKCHQATISNTVKGLEADDLIALLRKIKSSGQDIETGNEEVDSLMTLGIIELRYQLRQIQLIHSKAKKQINVLSARIERTQDQFAKILHDEHLSSESLDPLFSVNTLKAKKPADSFMIASLLADKPKKRKTTVSMRN